MNQGRTSPSNQTWFSQQGWAGSLVAEPGRLQYRLQNKSSNFLYWNTQEQHESEPQHAHDCNAKILIFSRYNVLRANRSFAVDTEYSWMPLVFAGHNYWENKNALPIHPQNFDLWRQGPLTPSQNGLLLSETSNVTIKYHLLFITMLIFAHLNLQASLNHNVLFFSIDPDLCVKSWLTFFWGSQCHEGELDIIQPVVQRTGR